MTRLAGGNMEQLELFPDFIKEQQKLANDDWEHRWEQARLKTIEKARAEGQPVYCLLYEDEGEENPEPIEYECTHWAVVQAYNEMISEQAILCEFDDFLKDVKAWEYSHFDMRPYDVPYNFE